MRRRLAVVLLALLTAGSMLGAPPDPSAAQQETNSLRTRTPIVTPSPSTLTPTSTPTSTPTWTPTPTPTPTPTSTPTWTTTATATTTPTTLPDCRVRVYIRRFRLVTATDADLTDGHRWDEVFVVVNGVTNAGKDYVETPDTVQLQENETHRRRDEQGQPVPRGWLVFDEVVGKKGDRVDIYIRIKTLEIDNRGARPGPVFPGAESDEGFGADQRNLTRNCRDIRGGVNFVVHVDVEPKVAAGFAADPNDKAPPVHGQLEVRVRADIDP